MDDIEIATTMQIFGGGFAKALALAYLVGDSENQRKIRDTWPELWEENRKLAEMQRERGEA